MEANHDIEKDPAESLKALLVFESLAVGPVKIEPKRIIAPYRLRLDGREEATELIYTFEETVFNPQEPESINLASMIAAQVALNYGLFCRSLIFHGIYDEPDRRFIRNMASNTAREIYVKKFLEPNPFLIGELRRLPPIQRRSHLLAQIVFPDSPSQRTGEGWKLWPTDKRRACILSSGGKDSLLSFGLMQEILANHAGASAGEVHPVFINESGRHWFTALNAYRYFREHIPHSTRVWVNSDRIFNWMLRHMPFIRKDFADVRSDQYPIRLWTVAVFLFGALPLMRKRRVGRLLIGNEFDTTQRSIHKGIRHYDGLYDQSIYFDQALSRYFLQKGWSISQFSILRPLSELLIEKILVERFPHLQGLQVSCHAAHKADDGIYPCGRCEKCRRIVGMLLAIGADPQHCGYSAEKINFCLKGAASQDLHQEGAAIQQLFFMLAKRTDLDFKPTGRHPPRSRPEIMKLRFDPEKSPLNGIPQDLRKPLYRIMLAYAQGAACRKGRKWEPYDILSDPLIFEPYPFEHGSVSKTESTANHGSPRRSGILWSELTWPEAEKRLGMVDVALLPVGSIEQHGPHLPLDVDAFDAEYLAKRVAETCSDPKPLVLPLISYGVAYHHVDFSGTLSISNEALSRLVYDVGMSTAANGITKLVIINGHGGNGPALNYAAQMINRDAQIFVCVDSGETSDIDIARYAETPNDVHAGEIETSTILAVRPHMVQMELASPSVPEFSSRYLDFSSTRGINWYAATHKISASGVMGDPTKASPGKGARIWEIMIAHLVTFIEDLKQLTLEEIYHRRY